MPLKLTKINFKDKKFDYPIVRIVFVCHPETLKRFDMMLLEKNMTRTAYIKQRINEDIETFEHERRLLNV